MSVEISVLVVNLNNLLYTRQCIEDLLNQDVEFNLRLVDQNSTEEGTNDFFNNFFLQYVNGEFTGKIKLLEIIHTGYNRPLNYLWNEFVDTSSTDFLCLLNLFSGPQFLEKLGAIAINRAPRLMDVGIGKGWAGLYEVTPDHNAILGEFKKISRFFYATGFSGHGFLQGPAIGEILRDLYLNKQPFVNIDKLSAERFSGSGQLRPEYNIV